MTRDEAREFLIYISHTLGNMGIEYLTEKDGEKMREAIETLEQWPKIGHWIKRPNGFKCSKCLIVHKSHSIYCPSCGARMIEPQESEE